MAADLHLALVHRNSTTAERMLRASAAVKDEVPVSRPDSILARALLRAMLAELTGSRPECWIVGRGLSGAPLVHSNDGSLPPSISLSHSGSWVACAASFAGSVGIDVELHKGRRDHHGIAKFAFGIQEREAVAHFGDDRFYAVWTLREAMAKATGEGLRRVADSVDRVAAGPFDDTFWSALEDGNWWLMHKRPSLGLSLAAALHFGATPQRPIELDWRLIDDTMREAISQA